MTIPESLDDLELLTPDEGKKVELHASRRVVKARLASRLLNVAEQEIDRLYAPKTYRAASAGKCLKWSQPEPEPVDRKHILLTAAIAIDKSALLAGEATGRTEHIDIKELDAALNEAIPDAETRRKLALRVLRGGARRVGAAGGNGTEQSK